MTNYSKKSEEEILCHKLDKQKKTFPPEENEFMEIHWGSTPLGGDLSIGYYYDKDGNHCTRENMAYMNIVIYTKDGQYVNSVYGKNPYH